MVMLFGKCRCEFKRSLESPVALEAAAAAALAA